MKKVLSLATVILFTITSFQLTNADPLKMAADTAKKAKTVKTVYTCTMHPDVISFKPGKCPKPGCGMTLVKKTDKSKKMPGKMKM